MLARGLWSASGSLTSRQISVSHEKGMCLSFLYRTGHHAKLHVKRLDSLGRTRTLWTSVGPEPASPALNPMWATGLIDIPRGKYRIVFHGVLLLAPERPVPDPFDWSPGGVTSEPRAPTVRAALLESYADAAHHRHYASMRYAGSSPPPEIWLDSMAVLPTSHCKRRRQSATRLLLDKHHS